MNDAAVSLLERLGSSLGNLMFPILALLLLGQSRAHGGYSKVLMQTDISPPWRDHGTAIA